MVILIKFANNYIYNDINGYFIKQSIAGLHT